MLAIKILLFLFIIIISTYIGIIYSQKFINRVNLLKNFKSALIMLKTKIQYTYLPLGEIFIDIANSLQGEVGKFFQIAHKQIETLGATQGFNMALENTKIDITKQDKETLKNLSKMLGATDISGQVNEIELTLNFLEKQIEQAEIEKEKNAKLYKTFGAVAGITIVIILL